VLRPAAQAQALTPNSIEVLLFCPLMFRVAVARPRGACICLADSAYQRDGGDSNPEAGPREAPHDAPSRSCPRQRSPATATASYSMSPPNLVASGDPPVCGRHLECPSPLHIAPPWPSRGQDA
jgi:hypothetical protein